MPTEKRSDRAKLHAINSWRDVTPMLTSVGPMLHNLTGGWRFIKPRYEDKTPACQNACPAGNDIEGWIKLLQKGDPGGALRHLKQEQPFPAILGRVCFHTCRGACNRTAFDAAVNIPALEQYLGDRMEPDAARPAPAVDNGRRMAVVGSGPAGMAAAYFARLMGFHVTLIEAETEMGGILRFGIPAYRLPRAVVAREIAALAAMGVDLRPRTVVGKDLALDQLSADYHYVLLATGCHRSLSLGLEGETESGDALSGLTFLKQLAFNAPTGVGENVVVVGGGNTAIDAARSAVRLGCRVTVLYRRGEQEMPAHREEIDAAREEGVTFRFLAAPIGIERDRQGGMVALKCCEMSLGAPDASGRRRPAPKDGAEFTVPADTLITAVGEAADMGYVEGHVRAGKWTVPVDPDGRVAEQPASGALFFAAGDMTNAPHTVVHAVAAGKKAAIAIDCHHRGRDVDRVMRDIAVGTGGAVSFARYMGWLPVNPVHRDAASVVGSENMVFDYFVKAPARQRAVAPPEARQSHFDAYRQGFAKDEAAAEADRCLHCGRCTECDNCFVFCPDVSVMKRDDGSFGYSVDYDYCKGCGICYTECPRSAITMVDEETPVCPEEV